MRANFWSGLVVFSISVLLVLWIIPSFVGRGFGGSVPPKFMPMIGVSIMMAASAVVVVKAFFELMRAGEGLFAPIRLGGVLYQAWPFAFVALAIIAISQAGLVYSGPFVIAALLLLLGERRPAVVIPSVLIPPALIWVLATQLMRIGMV